MEPRDLLFSQKRQCNTALVFYGCDGESLAVCDVEPQLHSTLFTKLAKAVTVISRNIPHRWCGQGPSQCRLQVRSRFAFPGAPSPGIQSISCFREIFLQFPGIFPEVFLRNPRTDPSTVFEFSHLLSAEILVLLSCQ